MILDNLSQWQRYSALSPRFAKAFQFLLELGADPALGRHDLEGDAIYALVQKYTTRPVNDSQFEAHRKYIDVQYLHSGRETILWAPLGSLQHVVAPYDEQKDAALFGLVPNANALRLGARQFTIFFPEDGHAPCCQWDGPSEVVKVVVKVRV